MAIQGSQGQALNFAGQSNPDQPSPQVAQLNQMRDIYRTIQDAHPDELPAVLQQIITSGVSLPVITHPDQFHAVLKNQHQVGQPMANSAGPQGSTPMMPEPQALDDFLGGNKLNLYQRGVA